MCICGVEHLLWVDECSQSLYVKKKKTCTSHIGSLSGDLGAQKNPEHYHHRTDMEGKLWDYFLRQD